MGHPKGQIGFVSCHDSWFRRYQSILLKNESLLAPGLTRLCERASRQSENKIDVIAPPEPEYERYTSHSMPNVEGPPPAYPSNAKGPVCEPQGGEAPPPPWNHTMMGTDEGTGGLRSCSGSREVKM